MKRGPDHIPLTSEVLAASYDLLRETPPFLSWNLPPSEDVEFKVTRVKKTWGDYHMTAAGLHCIRLSDKKHGHLPLLLATMAHEMIHLHMGHSGMKGAVHGEAFQKLARQVCAVHGFDPKAF